jgi:hypothetical protein
MIEEDFLSKSGRRLEDAFFIEKDKKLLEQLHKMQKMKEDMASLEKVSGIKNEAILSKLISHNIRPETVAALSLIPIIEIAWADGKLDSSEKEAILKASDGHFNKGNQISKVLLDEWLSQKPATEMLDAWVHYIKGLVEILSKKEASELKVDLLLHARDVAESSGGFLGINKISKEEERMLKVLENAFS